jgi:hypothetical protein
MNLRRDLTPADHANIRRQLVLIPAYVWGLYAWTTLLTHIPRIEPLRDFVHFYILGIIGRDHHLSALYDRDAQAVMLKQVIPSATIWIPPMHGPQMALFFSPLARLSYTAAVRLWNVLSLIVYGLCGYALWKACPNLRNRRATTAVLLIAAPALYFVMTFAQSSAIGLVCLTTAFLALRANRPFLAGLAIGSLIYKPQLGLVAAVVFVGAGEWWIVIGAIVGAAAQLAVGAVYWGPSALVQYVNALRGIPGVMGHIEPAMYQIHGWRGFFGLLPIPGTVSITLTAVASVLTALLALACWRARGPLAVRYSAFVIATTLVDPHMYVYDLLLLTPAFMLLWDWSLGEVGRIGWVSKWSFQTSFAGLLYVCYFSPLLGALAAVTRLQVSALALTVLCLQLYQSSSPRAIPTVQYWTKVR